MGTRSNFPRAEAEGLIATLNVSSHEVKISAGIPLLPPPGLHFMDRDSFTITACFVVNCVRSLIPKFYGFFLTFYDFVHPYSKPPAGRIIQ